MYKTTPIIVKCTGGAAAQLLALSNAIYVSRKLNRAFIIKYYPYSTGTYWKFHIDKLLDHSEVMTLGITKGLGTSDLKEGEIIQNFPIRTKRFTYEHILQFIHFLHLDVWIRYLKKEVVIGGKRKRLDKVTRKTLCMTGNFVPLMDTDVISELSKRLSKANIPNLFDTPQQKIDVVIHYRLGDMRKFPGTHKNFGGHGVVNPKTFREILEFEKIDIKNATIKVASDEPALACRLLKDVGIIAYSEKEHNSLWDDLRLIGSAKLFIGSMSQLSFFGATICTFNSGKAYVPSRIYEERNIIKEISIKEFNYYTYSYLTGDHYIFKKEF